MKFPPAHIAALFAVMKEAVNRCSAGALARVYDRLGPPPGNGHLSAEFHALAMIKPTGPRKPPARRATKAAAPNSRRGSRQGRRPGGAR